MKNCDLIVRFDEVVTELEMLTDTFTAIDEALRKGETQFPENALVIPCNLLFKLSKELRQIENNAEGILLNQSKEQTQ